MGQIRQRPPSFVANASRERSTTIEEIYNTDWSEVDEEGGEKKALKKGVKKRFAGLAAAASKEDKEPKKRRKLKVLEVFTWTMMISMVAAALGWHVMEPVSKETGWDLRDRRVQTKVLEYVARERPDLVVCAWPCTAFSSLQYIKSMWPGQAEKIAKRQEEDEEFIRFAGKLCRLQQSGGRHFLGENPWTSTAWQTKAGRELLRELDEVKTDMCAHGLVDPEWKYPVRKKTKLVVTSKEIARKLALQCTCAQKGKQHRVIKGTWRVDGKRVPASNWCGGNCTGFPHNVLEAFGEQVKDDMLECYTAVEEHLIDEDMRKIFEDDCPEEPLEKKRR